MLFRSARLGAAQTGLNQLADARMSYETALTHAPDEMLGYQRLAQLVWRNMNDPAGAKAVLDRMAVALPQEPEAYLIRARFETYLAEDRGLTGAAAGNVDRALKDLLAAGVRASVVAPEPELGRWFSWQWYWTGTLVDDLVREGRPRRVDGHVMTAGQDQPDGEQEHPVTSEDSG